MSMLRATVAFTLVAFLVCSCIARRAYSIHVQLQRADREEVRRFRDELAAGMNCRTQAGHDERHSARIRVIRYCEPGDPSRAMAEVIEESTRLSATVIELNQDGPVRPGVQVLAQELQAKLEARFGRERISIKRMNLRV
jgi:hypothetical protein